MPDEIRPPVNSIEEGPDGWPMLAGQGIGVHQVVLACRRAADEVEAAARDLGLTPARIHAALAYYYDHRAELDALIRAGGFTPPDAASDAEMTASEIAALYGVTPQAVRLAAGEGRLPARKSGATWLIRRSAAEARWGRRKG